MFWRSIRIVCLEKSSSCLARTIKLLSPSFPFPPFSPLSSSSSRFPDPLNIISDLLTKECGFSSSQVAAIMRRQQQLLRTKSDHTAKEAIQLLKDSGFTENKLRSFIYSCPSTLQLKADSQLKPKMGLLKKMGFANQDIVHIVSRASRFLSLSIDHCLAPRILYLETLFGSKDLLCKALKKTPQLLTSDFEKHVKPRVEYLKNTMGILEGSTALAKGLNAIIGLKFQTIEAKTKYMASLGLTVEEIAQILKVYPLALRTSTKKLKECIEFLVQTAGLQPGIVALKPVILAFSVEKRLKPRYELFKSLSSSPPVRSLPSLVSFFFLTEQSLLKYVDHEGTNSTLTIIQSPKAKSSDRSFKLQLLVEKGNNNIIASSINGGKGRKCNT